jgi:hypothetical protein
MFVSCQPAPDEAVIAFQNSKISLEIDGCHMVTDGHLLGLGKTVSGYLNPFGQFPPDATGLGSAVLLELIDSEEVGHAQP